MSVKKAIRALSIQIEKLDENAEYVHGEKYIWQVQTKSYIETFFGEKSREFDFINHFSFIDRFETDEQKKIASIPANIQRVKIFLSNCIETLAHKGLNEKEKNFLSRISDLWLGVILTVLLPGLFIGGTLWGKYLADVQNIELKQENKQLKETLFKRIPTLTNTNIISKDSADSAGKEGN